ncbi:MAG TPA: CcmD family protein [Bacteroidia bacterium]
MKKFSLVTLLISSILTLNAQGQEVSTFRSSGKIYVVVGIIAIIFLLIVAYLFYLDYKITKLENKDK